MECILIDLCNNNKRTLFGLFYRPPNSDLAYYSRIEDFLHLAVGSGINDIIITGDFNFNMLYPQSSRMLFTFRTQFALFQAINKPIYEGRSFNVVIRFLQGALLIPFIFRLLQPFEVVSLDGNTLLKSRNPFCKGKEVGLFRYTLKTLVNCTTKCTSRFITTTEGVFVSKGNSKKSQGLRSGE